MIVVQDMNYNFSLIKVRVIDCLRALHFSLECFHQLLNHQDVIVPKPLSLKFLSQTNSKLSDTVHAFLSLLKTKSLVLVGLAFQTETQTFTYKMPLIEYSTSTYRTD